MRLSKKGKRRLILLSCTLLALVMVGAGLFVAREVWRASTAEKARVRGIEAFEAGRYTDALRDLGVWVGRHRDDIDTLIMYADSRLHVPVIDDSHFRQALSAYQVAFKLNPRDPRALEGLMSLYGQIGRLTDYRDMAERLHSEDPTNVSALRALATADLRSGSFDQATDWVRQLCDLEPDSFEFRAMYLTVRYRAGDSPAERLAECDRLISEQSQADGNWLLLRAQEHLRSRDRDAAKIDLLAAAQRGVERNLLENLMWTLEAIGERDAAAALLTQAIEDHGTESWPHLLAVRRAWTRGLFEDAKIAIQSGLSAVDPTDATGLLRWRALVQIASDADVEARATFDELRASLDGLSAPERDFSIAWIEALEARLSARDGNWSDAADRLALATSRSWRLQDTSVSNTELAVLNYMLGEAYLQSGETNDAIREFEAAHARTSRMWVMAGVAKASAQLSAGLVRDAFDAALQLTTVTNTEIFEPWALLARSWIIAERVGIPVGRSAATTPPWPGALAYVQWLYESSSQSQQVLPLLIQAHLLQGDDATVRSMLENAALSDEITPAIRLHLARLALDFEDIELAEKLIEALPDDSLESALDRRVIECEIMAGRGDSESALAIFSQQVEDESPLQTHRRELALVQFARRHRPDDVVDLVTRLIESPAFGVATVRLLLNADDLWKDRAIADQFVDRVEAVVRPNSTLRALAKAEQVLRFSSEDSQKIASARKSLDELRREQQDSLPVLVMLARLYMVDADESSQRQAAGYLQRAVERFPHETDLYPRLVALLQARGEFAAASRYLSQLQSIRGRSAELNRSAALLYAKQGDYDAALASVGQLSNDEDATETDRLMLALWEWRIGNYAAVRPMLTSLLQSEQPSSLAVLFAMQFYTTVGEYDTARNIVESSPLVDEAHRRMLRGVYFQQVGDQDAALHELTEAVREQPDNPTAQLWLARYYLGVGDFKRATEQARSGLENDPDNEDFRLLAATIGLRGNPEERDQALRVFQEITGSNEALIETIELFTEVMGTDGSMLATRETLADVEKLFQKHPSFLPAARLAVEMHRSGGRLADALRLAQRAIILMPDQAEPCAWETTLLVQMNNLRDAETAATRWLTRSRDEPLPATRMLAAIAFDQKAPQRALNLLAPLEARIVARRVQDPDSFRLWLMALALNNRVSEAYRLVLDSDPQDEGLFEIWVDLAPRADPTTALQILEHAEEMATSPGRRFQIVAIRAEIGARLSAAGDGRSAECFRRADELLLPDLDDPGQFIGATFNKAVLESMRGNVAEAIDLYDQVLDRAPENPFVMNNLSLLLSGPGRQTDRALSLARKLIDAHPDEAEFADTFAQVLLAAGQTEEALVQIESALAMQSKHPGFLITRAKILLALNRRDEASAVLDSADSILRQMLIKPIEFQRALAEARSVLISTSP